MKPHKYNEDIEQKIASGIIDSEVSTAQKNQEGDIGDYDRVIDMLECKRSEKEYDWMSDVFIPELPSIILTDAGMWANQYFQSRGFVDCILEDGTQDGLNKCRAAKKLLNATLNRRGLYHYHKFIRGRKINALAGRVFAVCWWEKDRMTTEDGVEDITIGMGIDQFGNEVESGNPDEITRVEQKPKYKHEVVKDCFNYDIVDPANVFTDARYTYSVQEKDWVIIRSEKSLQELLADEYEFGYINLHILKEMDAGGDGRTDAAKATVNATGQADVPSDTPIKRWDIYERYGKYWHVEKEGGEIEPGLDVGGEPLDNAVLGETVITVAVRGSSRIIIRFQKQKNTSPEGTPYRPILRGICYIHPRKDEGLSDGKYLREPQIAINDNFNIGMDRVKLATLPTLIGRKYALQDNDTIYFEPEHVMEVEDPKTDIQELTISDNIRGTIEMNQMLTGKMQQVSSVYPTTMGGLPESASTTATAIAGAESRSNLRANYKSLTYENTFLTDFYTMILWMSNQYAEEDTLVRMMGEDAQYFDPSPDYSFIPVSSNVEMEASKDRKLQRYDQMLARLSPFAQNPKIHILINYILSRMFELQGDEFSVFKNALLDTTPPPQEEGSAQQAVSGGPFLNFGTQATDMEAPPTSNQSGIPMTQQEMVTRDQSNRLGRG